MSSPTNTIVSRSTGSIVCGALYPARAIVAVTKKALTMNLCLTIWGDGDLLLEAKSSHRSVNCGLCGVKHIH